MVHLAYKMMQMILDLGKLDKRLTILRFPSLGPLRKTKNKQKDSLDFTNNNNKTNSKELNVV